MGDLEAAFLAELAALEQSGAALPLTLRPSEAWYLLGALQLALRHPGWRKQSAYEFADRLARNIAERLGKDRPAMAEVAQMGFDPQFDQPAEGRRDSESAADPPPEDPKRKPAKPSPENKQIDAPENKEQKKKRK